MLERAQYRQDAFIMLENFVTQINDAYCGPASTVMVLNSLGVGQPLQPDESGLDTAAFAYYTQENVFDAETDKVKSRADVRDQGMSLRELSGFIAAHRGVNATFKHGRGMALEEFRDLVLSALAQPQTFVIANFLRRALNESGSGHHSPLAAYNREHDAVLVLDVSRYKYPAWWVLVPELHQAILPERHDPDDLGRGLVFVWSLPDAVPRLGREYITPDLDDGLPISRRRGAGAGQPPHTFTWAALAGAALAGVALTAAAMGAAVFGGVVYVAWGDRVKAAAVSTAGKTEQHLGGMVAAENGELAPLVAVTQ